MLLIDNELHPSTIANRIPKVAKAMELEPEEYQDNIDVWPLRGDIRSLESMCDDFDKIEHSGYKLVLLDAKYRLIKQGKSENDNSAETATYNLLDAYAIKTGAAFVLIHHSSKGSQDDKRVTDVGAGAGAQSRAADCHMILREHEQEGIFVLDAAVRSFKPVEPMALAWEFPVWAPAPKGIDTGMLKRQLGAKEANEARANEKGQKAILEALKEGNFTETKLRAMTKGCSNGRLSKLLYSMTKDGILTAENVVRGHNECLEYSIYTGVPK